MKIVYIVLGFIAMVIGSIGIVLPVLPTTPFYWWLQFVLLKEVKN